MRSVRRIWLQLRRLAARPRVAILAVGALSTSVALAISLGVGIPQPAVHDEFSYLLAADTFASGRLTNPTHPLWEFFESPHIIQQPSYASKFPPGEGLALALGLAAFGHAIVGRWLSAGFASACVTFMLYAWLPRRWALIGGLLVAAHPLVIGWSQQYWGGLLAMAGGGLVLGAFRQVVRAPRARHALVLATGLAVLAATRPYEGLVLGAPLAVALAVVFARLPRGARPAWLRAVALPLALGLAVTAAALLGYDARVTGDPLTLPYQVHERSYGAAPLFAFQDPVPIPSYRHEQLRAFHVEFERAAYSLRHVYDARERLVEVLGALFAAYWLGSLPALLLVALLLTRERGRWSALAASVLLLFLLGLGVESFVQPHYAAPAACLAVLLVVQALRQLAAWRPRGARVGQALVLLLLALVITAFSRATLQRLRSWDEEHWSQRRARLIGELTTLPGRDLVIVRYRPRHDFHEEWVYNRADIDAAEVVFAREMDPESMARLLDYFRERRIWLLEPDERPPRLEPYLRP